MKEKKLLWLACIFSSLLFTSCLEDMYDNLASNSSKENVTDLNIPSDFNWRTTDKVQFNVNVAGNSTDTLYTVAIYDKLPANGGSVIAKGAAKPGTTYTTSLTLAQTQTSLYIQVLSPSGNVSEKTVDINSTNINVDFSSANSNLKSADASYVAVPGSFDVTLTNSDTNVELTIPWNINKNMTYYVPENVTFNGKVNFNNWKDYNLTLYVKGKMNITSGFNIEKSSIIVLDGGSVTVNGDVTTGNSFKESTTIFVQRNATFTINGRLNYSNSKKITNFGSFNISDFDHNNSGTFENYGVLNTSNSLSVTNKASLFNYGTVNCVNNMEINSNGVVENGCKIKVANKLYIANSASQLTLYNGTSVESNQFVTSGGKITLGDNAIFRSQTASLENSKFYGPNVKQAVTDFNTISNVGSGVNFFNNIQIAYRTFSGTSWHMGNLQALAKKGVTLIKGEYTAPIESTECNGATPQIADTDKDGIPDDQDEYPSDANKAYTSYFPSQTGWGTYLMEDLWPSLGDYDMNDLVMNFRISYITNANNEVTQMLFTSKVKALGATNAPCGIAVQLDNVAIGHIASVSGYQLSNGVRFDLLNNGLEKGQSRAIFPVFEQSNEVITNAQAGEMINTVANGIKGNSKALTVTIDFKKGINITDLSPNDNLNVFMVSELEGKRKEIHLPRFSPSDKMSKDFFGTKDDGSDLTNGKFYLSRADENGNKANLIWGLMLPVDFEYPYEKTSIMQAYKKFGQWAESGGTLYSDWYMNSSSDYRNPDYIYKAE